MSRGVGRADDRYFGIRATLCDTEARLERSSLQETNMSANAGIVRGLYDSFARGDVAALLAAFDGAIEWREADNFLYADGNPYIGASAIVEGVMQRLASDVEQFAIMSHAFTDGGETVVVEGRYKGRMKATGRPVDAQFAHVWTLRDGKVIRFQQYTDTKQWSDAARA
jgi:uncharacterized protein